MVSGFPAMRLLGVHGALDEVAANARQTKYLLHDQRTGQKRRGGWARRTW